MDLQFAPLAADILRFLDDQPQKKAGVEDVEKHFPESTDWIDKLIDAGYIIGDDMQLIGDCQFGSTSYRLLPEGEIALAMIDQARKLKKEMADEEAKQHAEQEKAVSQARIDQRKERRHDYFVAIFSSLFGSLVTLLIEHFDQLIALIEHLIEQVLSFFA